MWSVRLRNALLVYRIFTIFCKSVQFQAFIDTIGRTIWSSQSSLDKTITSPLTPSTLGDSILSKIGRSYSLKSILSDRLGKLFLETLFTPKIFVERLLKGSRLQPITMDSTLLTSLLRLALPFITNKRVISVWRSSVVLLLSTSAIISMIRERERERKSRDLSCNKTDGLQVHWIPWASLCCGSSKVYQWRKLNRIRMLSS